MNVPFIWSNHRRIRKPWLFLDFYLFLLLTRKDSLALRPDQYYTTVCEDYDTFSYKDLEALSRVPWARKAHILYSVELDTLCPHLYNFFSLLPVSFFLPDHSQIANPLDHCCQFKVIQITNGLTFFPQGSQVESPTGTNWQGRQFKPSCVVFTFICRTVIIRSSYKGIMKVSPTLTILILTGINKCFKMLNTCPVSRE